MTPKPGYRTTEFVVVVLMLILNNVSALPIPGKYQGILDAFLPVGYALARGLAKVGNVPVPAPAPRQNVPSKP
jgi:hypothetical protein